jgi:mono/diheme cytochrome c family protein
MKELLSPWSSRRRICPLVLGCALALTGCDWFRSQPAAETPRPPVRITMQDLHAAGGVPEGWRFTPPPGDPVAGRAAFVELGCYTCHRVRGEAFPEDAGGEGEVGPELTGMGAHHPPEYFAESILNPNAVLVEGPGYIDDRGLSIMPAYPDMTLGELTDLVAYVQSLRAGGGHGGHGQHRLLAPPGSCESPASAYMIQVEEVTSEQLGAFDEWFGKEGAEKLKREEGVVSLDAYVNRSIDSRVLISVLGFDDDGALNQCVQRLEAPGAAQQYGGLLGEGSRILYRSPIVYKAVGIGVP